MSYSAENISQKRKSRLRRDSPLLQSRDPVLNYDDSRSRSNSRSDILTNHYRYTSEGRLLWRVKETSPTRTTRQLPTFIPLPVFRFTGPASPPSLDTTESVSSSTTTTSRRNTLANIILGRNSPKRSKSFGTNSENFPKNYSDLAKRNSLPCGTILSVAVNNDSEPKTSVVGKRTITKPEVRRKTMEVSTLPQCQSSSASAVKTPALLNTMPNKQNGTKTPSNRSLQSNLSELNNSSIHLDTNHRVLMRTFNSDGELNNYELDLLHHSANGNLEALKEIFEQQSYYLFHVNVNCVDSLDRSALSLATLNRHLEVIRFLLSEEIQGIKLGDALFYAIQSEFYEAIELLLEKDPQTSLQIQPGTTSPFEPGLTPFMLAAHINNYKILSMLYKYSHRLTFSDNKLLLDEGFDPYSWDSVMERLLHYKARASPAFMLLMYNEKGMSWDPMNASMDLFGELQELAKREREVDESYLAMAERCETFAMELLQEVRSANELADFMRYDLEDDDMYIDDGDDGPGQITTNSRQMIRHYLKPIEKAVKYEMKDFVTSDNSQLALIYIQKGSMFRRLKGLKATFVQIFLGMLFPFLSIAFLISPKSALGRLMRNPTVKFWCWLMSEVFFVIMLLTNTLLMQFNIFESLEAIPPLLIIAYFWILGKLFQELREIGHQGLREYLSDIWNWNDMATILFYTTFMVLRLVHIIEGGRLTRGDSYWHEEMFAPLPLSDIFIAMSYILIHMRIMELLRAERTFGPLQVSLDLMLHDTFRFLVIFCIVFLAFGSGITELYTPYGIGKNCTCNDTEKCNTSLPLVQIWDSSFNATDNQTLPACVSCKKDTYKEQQVTNFLDSLVGLYWTMFGYGAPQLWYPVDNCPELYPLQELFGGIVIGVYHFAAIIVLVNMLIAMMSNSFQKTHDDSEREWKFHRTQLWLKFIRNEINRPPPMNLIPRWKVVKGAFQWLTSCCCCLSKPFISKDRRYSNKGNRHTSVRHHEDSSLRPSESLYDSESKYNKVLRLVVLRYVKHKVLHGEMVI